MKLNKLPEDLDVAAVFKLAPYKIHLLYNVSGAISTDGYMAFHASKYYVETSTDVNANSITDDEGNYKVPVISFDGYNVLMTENCSKEHMMHLKTQNTYTDSNTLATRKGHIMINAYTFDTIDVKELTEEGIKQYNKACVALERFESIHTFKKKKDVVLFDLSKSIERSKPTIISIPKLDGMRVIYVTKKED